MENKDTFVKFEELLTIKRYSPNSIKVYLHMVYSFQKFVGNTPIERLDNKYVLLKVITYIKHRNYGSSSQKQLLGALALFYRELFKRQVDLSSIYPTQKEYFLPEILSKEEVGKLLKNTANLKHLTILKTIYALGLRRSEVLDLKINDIDGKRKLVHIKNAKGKKDRILPLSDKLLTGLREYYRAYKPTEYMFYGANRSQYSVTSLRKVFLNACKRSGIRKNVTLHSLRHAYATHLMDMGTDVRMIQELLGHNSIKTTMRYTHVTIRSIKDVPSPLDFLE